jgi:tetratricopeptide (TPR) repeat protein
MIRGRKLKIAFIAFGVFLNWALPQASWAAGAFEAGIEEFKLKRFWAAKAKFMEAVQQQPGNQKAYLYLGRCLEYLRETDDAQACFRACFSVNPFSEDGKRAKQFSIDIAGRSEASEHRAVEDPQMVIDSGLLIQRQALDLQARKMREMESYYKSRRNNNRRNGNFYTPYDLLNRDGNEVSNRAFIDQSHGIYDNMNEANQARLHGQRSAQSVQDTANALIERLGRKNKSSAPALRALGTNLYVQYFRSKNEEEDIPPPPDPPIELRATQIKFNDIPRAWKAQSKIFKFPTITTEDYLASKKSKSVDEALSDDMEKPRKKALTSASPPASKSTPSVVTATQSLPAVQDVTSPAAQNTVPPVVPSAAPPSVTSTPNDSFPPPSSRPVKWVSNSERAKSDDNRPLFIDDDGDLEQANQNQSVQPEIKSKTWKVEDDLAKPAQKAEPISPAKTGVQNY